MSTFRRLPFLLLCLLLFPSNTRAQSPGTVNDELKRPDVQHGIVLELNTRTSTVGQSIATINGLRFNWAMRIGKRHQTLVGLAGYGLLSPSYNNDPDPRYLPIRMNPKPLSQVCTGALISDTPIV